MCPFEAALPQPSTQAIEKRGATVLFSDGTHHQLFLLFAALGASAALLFGAPGLPKSQPYSCVVSTEELSTAPPLFLTRLSWVGAGRAHGLCHLWCRHVVRIPTHPGPVDRRRPCRGPLHWHHALHTVRPPRAACPGPAHWPDPPLPRFAGPITRLPDPPQYSGPSGLRPSPPCPTSSGCSARWSRDRGCSPLLPSRITTSSTGGPPIRCTGCRSRSSGLPPDLHTPRLQHTTCPWRRPSEVCPCAGSPVLCRARPVEKH